MKHRLWMFLLVGVLAFSVGLSAEVKFDRYHNPAEVNKALEEYAAAGGAVKLHKLAQSPSGFPVYLLEIGPETGTADKSLPAVFVAANMEGSVPLSTEAALHLIGQLVAQEKVRSDKTWYVLPMGNPDAAAKYFAEPLLMDPRNASPHNDDMDDRMDEDGVEDLNGDGLITRMRVKHPEGEWMPIEGEPRLMKRADWSKGEKGVYKLYTEGLDNDSDGRYNEDGPGGVNIGVQFPHLFKFFTAEGGTWAGSEAESFALIKFLSDHKEIGLTFVFGDTNFCLVPPRAGRRGEADLNAIKIPERYAGFMNADPNKTYTMPEVMDMVKPMMPPGMEVSESMIASFLGLGAVVNPLPEDLKFYQKLSEDYKEFLKTNKLDGKRLETARAKDGSLELWSYYHLGLPSFSLDFWTLPEAEDEKKEEGITPEQLEKMTNEEFIALGEEKIDGFLKAAGAPAQFKAGQVIEALKGGMMDTKRMAEMIKQMPKPPSKEGIEPKDKALLSFIDKELEGKGFVPWQPYKHPTLGEVEIGGESPFVRTTPPADKIEGLLKGQMPWIFEIAKSMARVKIAETKIKSLGAGVFEIKVWVENTGYIPYPTAMGLRNQRLLPVIVSLEGKGLDIVSGLRRSLIPAIAGHGAKSVTWIVHMEKPGKIVIHAQTRNAWKDSRTLDLGGSK
jgi:hypothetical protein